MTLDKSTRIAITQTVQKTLLEVNEVYSEEWLTEKQLREQCGFFTHDWLKKYGEALGQLGCREAVRVTDRKGVEHRTGWCYPKKKILRMIATGELRNLVIK